jgi:hypothetical protein
MLTNCLQQSEHDQSLFGRDYGRPGTATRCVQRGCTAGGQRRLACTDAARSGDGKHMDRDQPGKRALTCAPVSSSWSKWCSWTDARAPAAVPPRSNPPVTVSRGCRRHKRPACQHCFPCAHPLVTNSSCTLHRRPACQHCFPRCPPSCHKQQLLHMAHTPTQFMRAAVHSFCHDTDLPCLRCKFLPELIRAPQNRNV